MKKQARRLVALLIVSLACLPRIVEIDQDDRTGLILVWPWSSGFVEFVNSVTGGRVLISFKPVWKFSHFRAYTDDSTENYYTSGTYEWNGLLGTESESELRYCSIQGIRFKLGSFEQEVINGCLRARIVWPPF
ncbi:hypothetical protein [Thermodesulforhabdus norvegica]|uniref:Uncharacterized protein n=1 Tax=Thermodesulforhabdus norvegica TaxID=39841 RepID=A0A1I4QTK9_9BACT|nr:hypothetical protein [Thermodesulforhabdus norvegica]SFM43412.1 hypothetical protein SAMN05660836_00218 [Thermodesulforhabdus norvegica]